MSVEYVKLTERDLELVVEVFQMVVDYKFKTLVPHNWATFETRYIPQTVEAIANNQFRIADSHNNICTWLIDQINHSRLLQPGVKPRDCQPLNSTAIGAECIRSLIAAARGQMSYRIYSSGNTTYKTLFDTTNK